MKNGVRIGNIVCAVLSILLAGVLAFVLYANNRKENARSTAIQSMLEEVKPYEQELQEKRYELGTLKGDVSYKSEKAKIMVGFVASDVSDVNYIAYKAETYGFSPVLIIDCTMDMRMIERIVSAADKAWEIMLYAPTFLEDVNESVLSVMSYFEEGKENTGVFLLRRNYSTEANIQLLKDDGFIGYTSYRNSPAVGQNDDGTVYFDYSYLSTSVSSLESIITAMYDDRVSMLFALDMSDKATGNLEENFISELLDMLQSYTEKQDCSFSTVADVVGELSKINAIEKEKQISYEKQKVELQTQIEELEDTISEVYANLKY